jgi:hypothetical protein
MTDIVIIGAGMAGLVCAQQLRQAGYSVLVVEKSRGLGGRVATRRLYNTCADHGACYVKPEGELLKRFVELLCQRHILRIWTDVVYDFKAPGQMHPKSGLRFVAPEGMSAIAKFLGQGLEILLSRRVTGITQTSQKNWCLTIESREEVLTAKALVIAIPAPQAYTLLQPLGDLLTNEFLSTLHSVEFYPSLSVMAGYPVTSQLIEWKALTFVDDPILGWIGLDSSKRLDSQQPVFVVQSSANFAQHHLEAQDLEPAALQILQTVADTLELPWLNNPDWMQIHRWRYAFPIRPLTQILTAPSEQPLVCCGDWCGGNSIEDAMLSGLAAAEEVNRQLQQKILPIDFLNALT